MPTMIRAITSRLKTIATPWLLPSLALPLLTGPAHAIGLTGDFAPNLWKLIQTVKVDETPGGTTITEKIFDAYVCQGAQLSCVDIIDADNPASFGIVGSDAGDIGESGNQVTNAWTLEYLGPSGTLAFGFNFFPIEPSGGTDFGFFRIGTTDEVYTSSENTDNVPIPYSFSVATGDILSFGVYTADNNGGEGYLEISNFQFTDEEVPGPLPALGAGAAFAWSRKLRARVKTAQTLRK